MNFHRMAQLIVCARRAAIGVLILGSVAASAVACGVRPAPSGEPEQVDWSYKGSYVYESPIKLNDDREVTCLVYDDGRSGGLSCDWANAGPR